MTAGPWRSHACVWGAVVPFPSYAFGPETSSGTFGRDAIFSTAGDERPGGMVQACGLCGLTAPGRVAGLAGVWSLGRASKAGREGGRGAPSPGDPSNWSPSCFGPEVVDGYCWPHFPPLRFSDRMVRSVQRCQSFDTFGVFFAPVF